MVRLIGAVVLVLGAVFSLSSTVAQTAPSARPGLVEINGVDDVDRAIATRANVPPDTRAMSAAWKGIVADAARGRIKIIFDTDIGTDIDDAIALTFALRRPEFEICAITTSRGEVHERAALVSRLLQIHGRTDIPFAPGSPVMLNGETLRDKPLSQSPFVGADGDRPRPAADDAQVLFRRVIEASRGQVWLVILGPMTNAAILIRDHPELAAGLKGMICMGGEPTRSHKETNIGNDVEAARVVFSSGLLKFAATQDICVRLLLPKPDLDRLAHSPAPGTAALLELIGLWRVNNPVKAGPMAVDATALIWLMAPELFSTASMGLNVERGGVTVPAAGAPQLEVTTDVNAVAAHRLLMDTLTR